MNLSQSLAFPASQQGVVVGGNFNTVPYLYHAYIVEPKLFSYPLFIHLEWNKREPTNSCKGLLVPARSFGLAHASLLAEVSHDEAGRERPLLAGKAHALFPHKIVAV